MSPEAALILDHFFGSFKRSGRPILLLDYDGTLAPFRVNRFEAVPSPGVRAVLNEIQEQGATTLVVVTGRPAGEIAPLLDLKAPFEVWGLHGFERLYPDGRRELEQLPAQIRRSLDDLHEKLNRDAFGGLFEPKPNAAVMHWRGLSAVDAAMIAARTQELFEPFSRLEGFRLLPFESGLELRAGRDKGEAVRLLLDECDDFAPAAYLGDDLTDEAAFGAIKGRGLAVLVRPAWRETAADLWIKPPEELLEFLERWRAASSVALPN